MSDLVQPDIFCLAPLRGVTVRTFRNLQASWFTPPDCAVAPFIPTFAGAKIKPLLLKDVDPELGQSVPVVPQVIGKDPDQLRTLLRAQGDGIYPRRSQCRVPVSGHCPQRARCRFDAG